jgi:hypothetical protein
MLEGQCAVVGCGGGDFCPNSGKNPSDAGATAGGHRLAIAQLIV